MPNILFLSLLLIPFWGLTQSETVQWTEKEGRFGFEDDQGFTEIWSESMRGTAIARDKSGFATADTYYDSLGNESIQLSLYNLDSELLKEFVVFLSSDDKFLDFFASDSGYSLLITDAKSSVIKQYRYNASMELISEAELLDFKGGEQLGFAISPSRLFYAFTYYNNDQSEIVFALFDKDFENIKKKTTKSYNCASLASKVSDEGTVIFSHENLSNKLLLCANLLGTDEVLSAQLTSQHLYDGYNFFVTKDQVVFISNYINYTDSEYGVAYKTFDFQSLEEKSFYHSLGTNISQFYEELFRTTAIMSDEGGAVICNELGKVFSARRMARGIDVISIAKDGTLNWNKRINRKYDITRTRIAGGDKTTVLIWDKNNSPDYNTLELKNQKYPTLFVFMYESEGEINLLYNGYAKNFDKNEDPARKKKSVSSLSFVLKSSLIQTKIAEDGSSVQEKLAIDKKDMKGFAYIKSFKELDGFVLIDSYIMARMRFALYDFK